MRAWGPDGLGTGGKGRGREGAEGVDHHTGAGGGLDVRTGSGTYVALAPVCSPIDFTFGASGEYTGCFRDVLRGDLINAGSDLAGGNHGALNFTGSAGAGGGTWLTVYDPTPPDNAERTTFGPDFCLQADVLIHRFNNAKGAGLLALYQEGLGKKGLVLILVDNGNTDKLVLATVDQAGKLTQLTSVALGAGILENTWYRLNLDVDAGSTNSGDTLTVSGTVRKHDPSTNPSDATVGSQVGATLNFTGSLNSLGLLDTGEIGIVASATSAVVDTSVTNFRGPVCAGGPT